MTPMISRPLGIELALLGYLQRQPLHGYEIYQRLIEPEGLGRIWWMKQAYLYALLSKLEEAGYLTASIQPQVSRPARRMFRLTINGVAAFEKWLTAPVERPRQMRQEFHVKLYFAQQEGADVCGRLIDEQRRICRLWLAEQQSAVEQDRDQKVHLWLVDLYREGQIQAMLHWLDVVQEKLVYLS